MIRGAFWLNSIYCRSSFYNSIYNTSYMGKCHVDDGFGVLEQRISWYLGYTTALANLNF